MYSNEFRKAIDFIEKSRRFNINYQHSFLNSKEKEDLLKKFHPDFQNEHFKTLTKGENKGEKLPAELVNRLEATSNIDYSNINLNKPDFDVDVLIIGGGGAGLASAIEAYNYNANVMLVTKYRLGDSNTLMAKGGIQATVNSEDTIYDHFIDSYGGGRFSSNKDLLIELVSNGPTAINWLINLGVNFDKDENGDFLISSGGGTSKNRLLSAKDITGAEIMRVLKHKAQNINIPILENIEVVELLLNEENKASGAIFKNRITNELFLCRAKTIILATGGSGSLNFQGFPTSNFKGSTADGLRLAYRIGAELINASSFQYHPTGAAYFESIRGSLITEKARSLGAKLVNSKGEIFINPLETRDVLTASILRQCKNAGNIYEVWLDIPMIDIIHGKGTIISQLPALYKTYKNIGIDIQKEPILIYPTLHYQNGGLKISKNCMTNIDNLYAAGEITGGIHGKNRLMGNSLLDIIVFGRIAGKNAAIKSKNIKLSKLSIKSIKN